MALENPRYRGVAYIAMLLATLIVFWAYWIGLRGGIYFDDTHVIQENPHIQVEQLDRSSLVAAAKSFAAGGREVSMLSFGLNYYLFGEYIFSFKVVNLALHLLTGWLLYLLGVALLSALRGRHDLGAAGDRSVQRFIPLTAAAFWIAAPINLGPVLYISQRMTILASLFTVLGILLYLRIRLSGLRPAPKMGLLAVSTFLCTFLAYHAKENGILLIGYLALVEFVLLQDIDRWVISRIRASMVAKAVVLLCALVAGWLAWEVALPFVERQVHGYDGRDFTLYERVLTQFRAISFYISQVLVPNNAELSMWHDDFPVSKGLLQPVTTLVAIVVIVGLILLALVSIRRNRLISFSIFWFFLGHSLESTFIPLEMVHEHRNYLPSWGILLLLSYVVLSSKMIRPRMALVILGGFWVFNVGVLHARAQIWSNDVVKAGHEARYHPDSPMAQFNYARYLFLAGRTGDTEAAAAAERLLEHNITIDRSSIASEMLLVMLAYTTDIEFKEEWIRRAMDKLETYGYTAVNSRALSGVLEYLQEQKDKVDATPLAPLYKLLEDLDHPQLITLAAVFQLEVQENAEKGLALMERAAERANYRPAYRFNLLRAQIKLRRTEEVCRSLEEIRGLPFEELVMFQKELADVDRFLGDACDPQPL